MKKIIFYIVLTSFLSYKLDNYIDEECVRYRELIQVNNLRIGNYLPNFTAYTLKGTRVSTTDLNKERIFIFFKKEKYPGFLINNEILHKGLGKTALENNTDLLIGLDFKIANLYGLDIDNGKLKNSILFIVNKEHSIQKIYKDVCEDDIIRMLKNRKASPSNK